MKICVVGVGYVGLVTGTCLAGAGNHVVCVDKDEAKVGRLREGVIPIYEPGLTEMVKENREAGRLEFTSDLRYGVENSRIIFIAVGTPPGADGSPDLSAVVSVAEGIAENLREYRVIATKSTVPVGTHKRIIDTMRARTKVGFDYVSNPEFLKEGAAVADFMRPDRIIIGTTNPEVQALMRQLYGPFMRKSRRILFMDAASAEMTKYAANVMLATRISFMNEISELCEKLGADVEQVRQGLGSDSRIGAAFLFPGVGYGGSCLPKDIGGLIHTGQEHGVEMTLTRSVAQVNVRSRERFAQRVTDYFSGRHEETVLAVWGLAFKAKTDDVRESPAIYCIREFLECGMEIRGYDPEASVTAQEALGGRIKTFENGYDALDGADGLVIFTDWQEFRNPDFELIAGKLKKAVMFDGRNLYDPDVVRGAGIEYFCVGRGQGQE
jgi:UDPglucose 6-dehydrogenase